MFNCYSKNCLVVLQRLRYSPIRLHSFNTCCNGYNVVIYDTSLLHGPLNLDICSVLPGGSIDMGPNGEYSRWLSMLDEPWELWGNLPRVCYKIDYLSHSAIGLGNTVYSKSKLYSLVNKDYHSYKPYWFDFQPYSGCIFHTEAKMFALRNLIPLRKIFSLTHQKKITLCAYISFDTCLAFPFTEKKTKSRRFSPKHTKYI